MENQVAIKLISLFWQIKKPNKCYELLSSTMKKEEGKR